MAQRGILPAVSSTQSEPFIINDNNRYQIRTHAELDNNMDNSDSSTGHRTVLRLMDTTSIANSNEMQTFMGQSGNSSICGLNDMSSNTINAALIAENSRIEQLQQVHSSQDFHTAKPLTNFDENRMITSPTAPPSYTSTIGSIKFTPADE